MRMVILVGVATGLWLAAMPAWAACPAEAGIETKCDSAVTANRQTAPPPTPGTMFRDCLDCPEMVVIPAGSFLMGSPESEDFRVPYEDPQHLVSVRSFALGRTHVTRAEYAVFAAEMSKTEVKKSDSGIGMMPIATKSVSLYPGISDCSGFVLFSSPGFSERGNWHSPGYSQTERDPAVCVSWTDAEAYVAWLNRKVRGAAGGEGPYRLPSEAEWEYAARAGTTTMWFWGDSDERQCEHANLADLSLQEKYSKSATGNCRDGHITTSPAGSFLPNRFGLYDMAGNAWQWTADCWHENYHGAPGDGSARTADVCERRVIRGGSWNIGWLESRSAWRFASSAGSRSRDLGFRLARTLPGQ